MVETLSRIKKLNYKAKDVLSAVEGIIRQLAENIGSNVFELNLKSIETIDLLLAIMGNYCGTKIMEDLLLKSKIFLGEGKIPSFFRHIVTFSPKLLKPYAELIIKSTES